MIVMRSNFESDRLAASVTFAVKSKGNAVVGVPEIVPAPDIVKPGGRLPAATDHVYGVVPPVADSVCVYTVPAVPPNSDAVVIEGGVGAAMIVIRSNFESDRLAASVTFAVKSKGPAVAGVPEIVPAPEIVKPGGKLPAATDQEYGVVPPVADSVCV